MLLRLLRAARSDDRGSALAAVIGLMLVTTVVAAGILAAVVSSTAVSTSTRADVQSLGSADAGVDSIYAKMRQNPPVFACSESSTNPAYTATVVYHSGANASGSTLTCSGASVSGTPRSATITSVGRAVDRSTGVSQTGNTRRVVAVVDLASTTTTTGSSSNPLTKALYSTGALDLWNGNTLAESAAGEQDADTYSGGNTICRDSGSTIVGSVVAQGNATFTNQCRVRGEVWASGTVSGDATTFDNDLYSAGTGEVTLRNGAHVEGVVVADGAITLDGSAKACVGGSSANICGSALALGGALTLNNGSSVKGSGYAKTNITLQNPNGTMIGANAVSTSGNLSVQNPNNRNGIVGGYAKIQGSVNLSYRTAAGDVANSCQYGQTTPFAKCSAPVSAYPALVPAHTFPSTLGYPKTASVEPPATESMPTIGNGTADLDRWRSAGWSVETVNGCTPATNYINGMTAASHGSRKVLLNVTGCTSQLTWENRQFTVYNDFAVINPGGFRFYNGTNGVKSSSSTKREVSLIVPTGSTGTIQTDSITFTNVYALLYSPGTVAMQNQLNGFAGQIYAGTITGPTSRSTLTMHQMNVPGATATGASAGPVTTVTTWEVKMLSRLDVVGQ